jgi:hypothetical protein
MKLFKKLSREGKVIRAEVYYQREVFGMNTEILIDYKLFNNIKGSLFGIEPTQKTYDAANQWADKVIYLHVKNTMLD